MDSSFALIGAHQHGIAVGFMNGENSRQLHVHNTCGSCWLGTARNFSHDMRGESGSGVTLICVPVAASGKRKTEENLIFHYNFIQCSTEKLLFFVQHFCENIRIFVATTVLPLSTLCGLLEISKCLWHWRWRRSESFALRVFHNLNGVIWGNRMWLDKAHLERFLWFSIVVGKNLPLDLS